MSRRDKGDRSVRGGLPKVVEGFQPKPFPKVSAFQILFYQRYKLKTTDSSKKASPERGGGPPKVVEGFPTETSSQKCQTYTITPQSSLRLASSAQGTSSGRPFRGAKRDFSPFKKAFPLGVTPHGVGRCPEGTKGTAQYEGDRRQAVEGFQPKPFPKSFSLFQFSFATIA